MSDAGSQPDTHVPDCPVARAGLAVRMLARDPHGLKGMVLRARVGPARDRVLQALPGPLIRLHPAMGADALLGALDLAETLATGRRIHRPGLIARQGWFVLSMAERCPPDLAALICQALDAGHLSPLIVLDEGADPDERAPTALTERLALFADLDGASPRAALRSVPAGTPDTDLSKIHASEADVSALTALAARFGIDSLRPPSFALRLAKGFAALHDRPALSSEDIAAAAALTYAHRATQMPESDAETEPETPEPETPPPPDEAEPQGDDDSPMEIPESLLIDAVKTVLPPDVLAHLSNTGAASGGMGSGAGQRRKGNRRGRPLPSRAKRLTGQDRIDLTATLRAAAPWQKLRATASGDKRALTIWPSDIHVKRFEDRSDRLLIFAVDASGSAALARLSEAKGAVEMLLADAYATRDHVALIAFRGTQADLLLPPTRSLVQTKRRLAALPGGGGTPLASALKLAGDTAMQARRHGLTPAFALLTDGRANIALDGSADRAQATTDTDQMARWLASLGAPATVLDVGRRPHPALATLAATLRAHYVALPRPDAADMSTALKDTLKG